MNCADVRLDEFLDGELGEADRAAVEGHLASCAGCRAELDRSRKLDAVLRSVPAGAAPDADRFVQSVRSRSRRSSGGRWAFAAAALIAITGLAVFSFRSGPVDVRAELAKYSVKPTAEIENRIKSAGPASFGALEAALSDGDVKVQFAAASLLFKLADDPTRARVLACFQQKKESNGTWTLNEPGADDSDDEMVPITVSLALGGQDRWAMNVLRKLNRLNRDAQHKIVDSVVTLLHSTNVDIQRHALEIVKKLEIEFPLPALVELLDSPELGEEALRFLRQETRQDFGKDKQAWLKEIGGRK
jgi:hypothetical protein